MPSHWMPLYTGDYLKDTQRLSQGEHGAYILLILEYWNTGRPLPLSEKECNCIAKAFSEEERQNVGKILSLFFTKKSTGFHHKRIEKELKKNKEVSLKRKQAADKRWDANAYANNDANSMRSQPQLQPPSQLQLQNTPPNPLKGEASASPSPEKKPRSVKKIVPSDWQPPLTFRAWLSEKRPDVSEEELQAQIQKFKDNSLANGNAYLSFEAALRNWFTSPYYAPVLKEKNKETEIYINPYCISNRVKPGHERVEGSGQW